MYLYIWCMERRYISVLSIFLLHLNNEHPPKSEHLYYGFPQDKVLTREIKKCKQFLPLKKLC